MFATTLPSEHYPDFLLGSTAFRKLGLRRGGEAYGSFFNRISYHYHVYPPEEWRRRFEMVGFGSKQQTYYFSAAAHRRFDLCHYLGVPSLISSSARAMDAV